MCASVILRHDQTLSGKDSDQIHRVILLDHCSIDHKLTDHMALDVVFFILRDYTAVVWIKLRSVCKHTHIRPEHAG